MRIESNIAKHNAQGHSPAAFACASIPRGRGRDTRTPH
ncbi:lipoprotein [Lysobacter enzymogenes]|uniref:Lipoprotein n=1 Tax=Lysobacter enzymogenes TaxID=69 RepID=A0A0S2DN77_LYSEN|nr:lipoprotein [Lysobacter enzymogenes]